MRYLLISYLLATASIVAGGASAARAQDDALSICKASSAAYAAAEASGDPVKIAAQFTVNGVMTTPDGIFQGQQAIAAAYADMNTKPGASLVDTFTTARMLGGDVAVCSGGYTYTSPPGGPGHSKGNWTKVMAKSGKRWQLEQVQFDYGPPPAEPQSQAQAH